ncbi:GcrA family cell cycle regulator [Roseomonas xinghualingensis]|uniref:GcrA family cell cycle regulator n=1 Tax=Roseomonas xinghualingensis TaxID=2986475 RepID=UPI0021F1044E|nr:GcrA family cell cycle regulator [Roseomonas sp. SXEYE001]MCV4208454.1 GcrA family cell cycle regulator [Roseomonas sp. SXEYE001]
MDWSAEAIEQLRALWAEGHSTAEIGRRMGISKNAVVGKAHRLHLPARPSPIQREQAAAAAASPAPAAQRPAVSPAAPAAAAVPRPATAVAPRMPAPAPAMRTVPPAVVRPFQRSNARTCCWPIGEPGTPEFRFCTAEAFSGKPYCLEHSAIAYVKARDRREDAA